MQGSVFDFPRKTPIFPLQKLSLIKLSSIVCNNEQLLKLILKCHYYEYIFQRKHLQKTKVWKAAQTKANEIISQISNSVILREKIKEMFWPMSYRIIMWKFTYAPNIAHKFLRQIVWTDGGKINTTRTAKFLIENKKICVRRRFILACKLCLSEEIHETWLEMSNKDKRYYSTKYHEDYRPLLVFWVYTLEGSDDVVDLYIENALECAIRNNLFDAIKYLFSILEKCENYRDEKNEMALMSLFDLDKKLADHKLQEEDEIEIVYFLLSQIECTDENREAIKLDYWRLYLSLLFHSSDYGKFIKALQSEIEFLNVEIMLQMVFSLYDLEIAYQGNDYRNLFVDVWRALPTQSKRILATYTDLGMGCVIDLINHDFPFLLKAEAFKKMNELPISDLNCSGEKWAFLHFLIREGIAPLPSLEEELKHFTNWNKVKIKRVLRFLRKIRQQSL